tara:strand:+ start:1225 stop:2034 length:810 start_codon:yes stop_codon:yes gene_type:complete
MQMNKIQPKVVDLLEGRSWLLKGFQIFKKQPLIWILALLAYWTAMFLFGLIPVIGLIVSLIISPGIAFGFICLAKAVDDNQIVPPRIIISGFTGSKKFDLILLGFYYCGFLFSIFMLITLLNEQTVAELVSTPDLTITNETPRENFINFKIIGILILYIPIQMIFWFAPQLVVWGDLNSTKAMFYSFFAVLLNWKSFLTYLLTWVIILLAISVALALLISTFRLNQGALFILFIPVSLLIMSIAHCSYYASTKTIFSEIVVKNDKTNLD